MKISSNQLKITKIKDTIKKIFFKEKSFNYKLQKIRDIQHEVDEFKI